MTMRSLSGITPGMILENDVVTEKGSKLFPKGIKLTERHIEIMKAWDVAEAAVSDASFTSTALEEMADSSEEQETKRAKTEARLSPHDADTAVQEVNRKSINNETETGITDFSEE